MNGNKTISAVHVQMIRIKARVKRKCTRFIQGQLTLFSFKLTLAQQERNLEMHEKYQNDVTTTRCLYSTIRS